MEVLCKHDYVQKEYGIVSKITVYTASTKKKMRSEEIIPWLSEGDIILFGSWLMPLSVIIQICTKSKASHAEVYVGDGNCVGAHFAGIKKSKLEDMFSFHKRIICLRVRDSGSIGGKVSTYAESLIGRGYDFFHLIQYLWRIILGTLGRAPMTDKPEEYVCHEFAAICWHKFNIKVGGSHADNATGRSFTRDPKLMNVF